MSKPKSPAIMKGISGIANYNIASPMAGPSVTLAAPPPTPCMTVTKPKDHPPELETVNIQGDMLIEGKIKFKGNTSTSWQTVTDNIDLLAAMVDIFNQLPDTDSFKCEVYAQAAINKLGQKNED